MTVFFGQRRDTRELSALRSAFLRVLQGVCVGGEFGGAEAVSCSVTVLFSGCAGLVIPETVKHKAS